MGRGERSRKGRKEKEMNVDREEMERKGKREGGRGRL